MRSSYSAQIFKCCRPHPATFFNIKPSLATMKESQQDEATATMDILVHLMNMACLGSGC